MGDIDVRIRERIEDLNVSPEMLDACADIVGALAFPDGLHPSGQCQCPQHLIADILRRESIHLRSARLGGGDGLNG